MESNFIHPLADVQTERIGARTRIWQFCVVLPGATIGSDCNICSHCFIENKVTIGDRVTIKNGVYIWDGLSIHDDVFVGPGVTFTNDKYPRSRDHSKPIVHTIVESGASLGAACVILPGVRVGAGAIIGAGAVVTRDVPASSVVVGNPGIALQRGSAGDRVDG